MKVDKVDHQKGNRLIADFMNIKPDRFDINHYNHAFNVFNNPSLKGLTWPGMNAYSTSEGAMKEFYLKAKYHTSWDWIMPVVEQLHDKGCEVQIGYRNCKIEWSDDDQRYQLSGGIQGATKLEAVWTAIVYFLDWVNGEDLDLDKPVLHG